jgi:hypothetical protein
LEEDDSKPPVICKNLIRFNGIGDDAYETFYQSYKSRENSQGGMGFCKTAHKPYDMAVCEVLLILKYHYPEEFELSSDGFVSKQLEKNWKKALTNVKEKLGFNMKYDGETMAIAEEEEQEELKATAPKTIITDIASKMSHLYDKESIELCITLLQLELEQCTTEEEKKFLKNGIDLIEKHYKAYSHNARKRAEWLEARQAIEMEKLADFIDAAKIPNEKEKLIRQKQVIMSSRRHR